MIAASPLLIVALGLFSAVTLALANVSVKLSPDILVGRAVLSCSAALMIAPAAMFVAWPDSATWHALAIAIPAHFAYQLCLVAAMQRGDLSLVFPIMRGSAPLLTAVAAVVLLGEHLSAAGWAGLLLASAAVVGFAWPPRGVALRAHPDRVALGFAALTAVGIALYNVADARGVRVAPAPWTFIVWLFICDCLCISAYALTRRGSALLIATMRRQWRLGAAAGLLSILSFGAALYGFTIAQTARVSALRETAVVFAAVMGAVWLGEGFGPRRIVCAIVMAAGLALMQAG